MKKILSKSIVAIFALIALGFAAPHAFAASSFSPVANDCSTVGVGNFTTGAGINSTGWNNNCWAPSVSADQGQIVNVRIYYHNTGTTDAASTTVHLNQPSGTMSTASFSGSVSSTSGGSASGSGTINLSSPQILSYGSVKWYPDQMQTPTALPLGQSGSEIFASGLNLGTIAPGWSHQGSVVVSFYIGTNVQQQSCVINSFVAAQPTVPSGSATTLSWSTTGCATASITNLGSVPVNSSYTQSTGPIYGTTTFTLNAYSATGQAANPMTVTVSTSYVPPPVAVCTIGQFYATPSSITQGTSTTLYWVTNGASYVTISGSNGYYSSNLGASSQQFITPTTSGTITYTLTAYCNNYGALSQTSTTYVYVTPYVVTPVSQFSVATTIANYIGQTSARLNGLMAGGNGGAVTSYFEWGTTQALGNTTNTQNLGNPTSLSFNDGISGLSPNTTYYFRAVATNNGQTLRGDIVSFRTAAVSTTTVVTQVIASGGGNGSNFVSLSVANRYQNICPTNTADYTVDYKNISNKTLSNVVLRIALPTGITFTQSSVGSYGDSDNSVTVPIGTLVPGQSGQVFVSGIAGTSVVLHDMVVATATMAFTNPTTTAQEDAIAYAINSTQSCRNNSNLAGLAFFSGGFFPTTLVGWLILIAIILALVWLANELYSRRKSVTTTTTKSNGDSVHTIYN